VPFDDLPPWDEQEIMIYPMVWTCPVTGQRSFQVHPVPVYKMHLKTSPDGPETTLTDLAEIRALLNRLQRPAISPQYVWAPAYSPGDLVIFYNRGEHRASDLRMNDASADYFAFLSSACPSQPCTTRPVSASAPGRPRTRSSR
jgi:alpha-ketoglutarate-dependent taurine dioxygenase